MTRHLINDFTLTGIHIFYLEYGIGFKLRRWALKIMSYKPTAVTLLLSNSTISSQVLPMCHTGPPDPTLLSPQIFCMLLDIVKKLLSDLVVNGLTKFRHGHATRGRLSQNHPG